MRAVGGPECSEESLKNPSWEFRRPASGCTEDSKEWAAEVQRRARVPLSAGLWAIVEFWQRI